MAKRRRFSRWRRLPGVYRFGDEKPPDPNLEPQRLTLYVTGHVLDRAEAQADRLNFETVEDYCASLLIKAIDAEHVRGHMAEIEAKHRTLEGLHEIADDPEYLAELSAASAPREYHEPPVPSPALSRPESEPLGLSVRIEGPGDEVGQASVDVGQDGTPESSADAPDPRTFPKEKPLTLHDSSILERSAAARVVFRHAGQSGDDSPGFLPSLRRGEGVAPEVVAELAQALHQLECEYQGSRVLDRALSFSLHRLAFESQILHTDAWPDSFDAWTVETLRAVQEAVERILSGQDIRYANANDPAPD
ncbi:MAG: hypothetical protein NVSMB9_22300 [Isosphaeraceae bacterium]